MPAIPLLAQAGTDVASLVLLDPEAQPKDFDSDLRRDGHAALSKMQADGRGLWFETGADGAYLAHVYVESELPPILAGALHEPVEVPSLVVQSGRLLFAGAEYAHGPDDSMLRKYPAMGTFVPIPSGRYTLVAWRTEWPDNFDELLDLRAGFAGKRWRLVQVCSGLLAIGAGILALVRASTGSFGQAALIAVVAVAVFVAIRAIGRLPAVTHRSDVAHQINMERPSVVFQLLATESSGRRSSASLGHAQD